jgi:Pentapeptide repeats (9 copies)
MHRGRKRAGTAVLLIALFVMTASSGASAGEARSELPEESPLLFVLRGEAKVSRDRLSIATRRVEWFTDRPERRAGISDAAALVRDWHDFGFDQTPPNSALAGDGVDAVVVLSEPVMRKGTVRFTTSTLRGELPRGSLGDISLFIDATTVGADCTRAKNFQYGPLASEPPPDFSGAQLQFCDLTGRNLRGWNLSGANMYNVQFSLGDLSGANLTGANLTNAYMYQAWLMSTNLTDANLRALNLTQADLTGATLAGNNTEGTEWLGAKCPDGRIATDQAPCV